MRSPWVCLLCLALAIGFGWAQPRTALAQDAAELQAARDKFQKALALQTGGDWAGALALLKEVAAVRSTPQVRFNIALCEENLGQLVAAAGDYELAAADAGQRTDSEVVEQAQRRLEQLKGRIPKIIVERGKNADTATITLDGVTLGDQVIGKAMNVDPGPHVITARAAGFESFRATVRLEEAETKRIQVSLEVTPTKPSAPISTISPTGPRPPPDDTRLAGYIAGGVGVASLAAAGVMFGLRQGAINELDRECEPKCPSGQGLKDVRRRGRRYTTLGNVGMGVGILGVGLGAFFLLTSDEDPDTGLILTAPNSLAGASYRATF